LADSFENSYLIGSAGLSKTLFEEASLAITGGLEATFFFTIFLTVAEEDSDVSVITVLIDEEDCIVKNMQLP
jgi:hypothetical protein